MPRHDVGGGRGLCERGFVRRHHGRRAAAQVRPRLYQVGSGNRRDRRAPPVRDARESYAYDESMEFADCAPIGDFFMHMPRAAWVDHLTTDRLYDRGRNRRPEAPPGGLDRPGGARDIEVRQHRGRHAHRPERVREDGRARLVRRQAWRHQVGRAPRPAGRAARRQSQVRESARPGLAGPMPTTASRVDGPNPPRRSRLTTNASGWRPTIAEWPKRHSCKPSARGCGGQLVRQSRRGSLSPDHTQRRGRDPPAVAWSPLTSMTALVLRCTVRSNNAIPRRTCASRASRSGPAVGVASLRCPCPEACNLKCALGQPSTPRPEHRPDRSG